MICERCLKNETEGKEKFCEFCKGHFVLDQRKQRFLNFYKKEKERMANHRERVKTELEWADRMLSHLKMIVEQMENE